jgi:hypothetical protein
MFVGKGTPQRKDKPRHGQSGLRSVGDIVAGDVSHSGDSTFTRASNAAAAQAPGPDVIEQRFNEIWRD